MGYSLPQTFDYLVREIPNPLGEVFREASAVIVAGGSVEEALATIKRATTRRFPHFYCECFRDSAQNRREYDKDLGIKRSCH